MADPPPDDDASIEDPSLDSAPTRVLSEPSTNPLSPTRTATGDTPPPSLAAELIGQRVGKILILELLGVGGMGRVYAGWDEKLERRVALKSIRRRHAPSDELKARFLQEAQILSKLQHPNICQIYDYIEGEDADFLVLELIEGQTLDDLEVSELPIEDRLKLALQLADVLAAAHAANVVHRDLKPANVMVTPAGDAKMLDFGIASSVGERQAPILDQAGAPLAVKRSESAFETAAGFVVGTPQFMSPEQARGEKATPASDIYSFGLLLQQLFTGKPPYDTSMPTLHLLAAVQEGRTEPVTGVQQDLAELIERLKSPAPGARPSARDAAERLRFIQQAPRRRRQQRLKVVAVAALALIAATMSFQAFRIRQESERAKDAAAIASREAATAEQVLEFLLSLFEASDPWQAETWRQMGSELTVREVLERSLERMQVELADQPLIRARLQTQVGLIHQHLGLSEQARPLLEAALEARRAAGASDLEIAESLSALGSATQHEGDFEKAGELYRQSLELRESAAAAAPELADSLDQLGALYSETGRPDEAEQLLQRAVELRLEAFGESDPSVAESLHRLANLDEQQGRLDLAEKRFRRALRIRERLHGEDHPNVARTLNALGITLDQQRELEEALAVYRRALGIMEARLPFDDPQLVATRMNIGIALKRNGEPEAAAEAYRMAIEGFESRLGPEHPRLGEALGNLGVLYIDESRYDEGVELIERARAIFEKAFGTEHPSVATCLGTTARVDLSRRRYATAEVGYRRAGEILQATLGPRHPAVSQTNAHLATTLMRSGRPEEARGPLEEALAVADESLGEKHPGTALTVITAAELERLLGNLDASRAHLQRAAKIMAEMAEDGDSEQQRARLLREQANLARDSGDTTGALELYSQAAEKLQISVPENHRAWVDQWQDHAQALRQAGNTEQAEDLGKKAQRLARKLGIEGF